MRFFEELVNRLDDRADEDASLRWPMTFLTFSAESSPPFRWRMPVQRLDGKRIAMTGAAGGLGGPLARLLRDRGAYVLGIDRVESSACDDSIVTDLSDDAALACLARTLADDTPDILVNLAGVMRFGLHEDQPSEALALCYRVNLYVPAVLAQASPHQCARVAMGRSSTSVQCWDRSPIPGSRPIRAARPGSPR